MTSKLSAATAAILGMSIAGAHAAAPPAVLTPTDPALRGWWRADAGVTLGPETTRPITAWRDQSQYGTLLAPRTEANANGSLGPFPIEERPHLVDVTLNGNVFPTVRFDREGDIFITGDPAVDGSGSTDRLYQTNNFDDPGTPGVNEDPLAIGDGTDFTHFIVFRPDLTSTQGLGWQAVFGKRGTNASLYSLQIKGTGPVGNRGQFVNVSYDGIEQYGTGVVPQEKVWHVTSMVIDDKGDGLANTDTIQWFDDGSESATTKMVDVGNFDVRSNPPIPNSAMSNRNPANLVPEPFGIGGHSQNCCGEGETFAGNIAELIIFARTLTPQERSDIENYLDAKYFAAAAVDLPGDYNGDQLVDGLDFDRWAQQYGNAPPAAPNADGNDNGRVEGLDLLIWQQAFGQSAPVAATAVPEPSGGLLLAGCAAALGARRVRRVV